MLGLLRFVDALEKIPRFCGKAVAWLILPLIGIIMFDVVSRKIPGLQVAINESVLYEYISATKLQEWEWHLHTIIFLVALGYTYLMNAHVRVDLVREKLGDKTQAWIEFLGITVFLFPYCLVMGQFSWEFVIYAFANNEASASLTGLSHRWAIKSFLLIGLTLLGISGLIVWLRHFVYLFGPESIRGEVRMNMLTSAESEHLPKISDEDLGINQDQVEDATKAKNAEAHWAG